MKAEVERRMCRIKKARQNKEESEMGKEGAEEMSIW
jgi:hypothetical protein